MIEAETVSGSPITIQQNRRKLRPDKLPRNRTRNAAFAGAGVLEQRRKPQATPSPVCTVCSSAVEGCYYEHLASTQPDGTVLSGRFEAGSNWTQFQYEAFQAQNPGYKALFWNGTAVWTLADD